MNTSCDALMRNNPGKVMSVYNNLRVVREALSIPSTTKKYNHGFVFREFAQLTQTYLLKMNSLPPYVIDHPCPGSKSRLSLEVDKPQGFEESIVPKITPLYQPLFALHQQH